MRGLAPKAGAGQQLRVQQPARGIAFDGSHLWITNDGGNSVTEVVASDGSLVRTSGGGYYRFSGPSGAGCSPPDPGLPYVPEALGSGPGAISVNSQAHDWRACKQLRQPDPPPPETSEVAELADLQHLAGAPGFSPPIRREEVLPATTATGRSGRFRPLRRRSLTCGAGSSPDPGNRGHRSHLN